jgi:hypothetical protein
MSNYMTLLCRDGFRETKEEHLLQDCLPGKPAKAYKDAIVAGMNQKKKSGSSIVH